MLVSDLITQLSQVLKDHGDVHVFAQNINTIYGVEFKNSYLSMNLRQHARHEFPAAVLSVTPLRKDEVLSDTGQPSIRELIASGYGIQTRSGGVLPSTLTKMSTAELYKLTRYGQLTSVQEAEFVRRWGENWRYSPAYQKALNEIPEDEWLSIQSKR